ncbi:MAG: YdgA family protein [Pseudomonadota bacterium]|nr:MAG: YdgA family protein [Pseudomonadota bacterium]
MKRLLIILIVVLIVVFGLAPRLVGGRAQGQYEQMIEQLRSGGAQVTSVKYNRGWFGAQANTELVFPLPPAAKEIPELPQELRFSLASTLRHGPLTSLGGFGLAEIDTQILLNGKQLFPADYPAQLRTLVALNGGTRTLLELPAVNIPAAGNRPAIDFRGLSGILNADAAFNRIDTRLESPGADIAGGKIQRLVIGDITIDSRTARSIAGLMLGDVKIALSHLSLTAADAGDTLQMKQLFIEGLSNAEGEMVSGSARYHIGSLKIGGKEFTGAELKVTAGNLSAPVLAGIQTALNDIQSQRIEPDMQGTAIMNTLVTQLPLLLPHDPTLAIDNLQIDTPDGRIEGRLKVQALGMRLQDLQGGMGFINKLQADAEIKVPETVFRHLSRLQTEKEINREIEMRRELGEEVVVPSPAELKQLIDEITEQQIANLLEQRLIVREEQQLVSTATFRNGRLTVNGTLVPLPFLPPPVAKK